MISHCHAFRVKHTEVSRRVVVVLFCLNISFILVQFFFTGLASLFNVLVFLRPNYQLLQTNTAPLEQGRHAGKHTLTSTPLGRLPSSLKPCAVLYVCNHTLNIHIHERTQTHTHSHVGYTVFFHSNMESSMECRRRDEIYSCLS